MGNWVNQRILCSVITLHSKAQLPRPAVRIKGLFPEVLSHAGWINGKLACSYGRITFLPTSEWDVEIIFHHCAPVQCFSTFVPVMGILENQIKDINPLLRKVHIHTWISVIWRGSHTSWHPVMILPWAIDFKLRISYTREEGSSFYQYSMCQI